MFKNRENMDKRYRVEEFYKRIEIYKNQMAILKWENAIFEIKTILSLAVIRHSRSYH